MEEDLHGIGRAALPHGSRECGEHLTNKTVVHGSTALNVGQLCQVHQYHWVKQVQQQRGQVHHI